MKAKGSGYRCAKCSHAAIQWMGQCPECGEWNSLIEVRGESIRGSPKAQGGEKLPLLLSEVEETKWSRTSSGFRELDRVLGGGIVEGSLTLIGGEPGVGKSTLLLALAKQIATQRKQPVLYVSGEESEGQIAARAKRLGIVSENLYVMHARYWQEIEKRLQLLHPCLMVLDSIQTTCSEEVGAAPGSPSQIREVTYEVMNYCKASGMSSVIIGHITKDGAIAGPKMLEHMVDTVVYFEGEQEGTRRILRAEKNRFGDTHEVGLFHMTAKGFVENREDILFKCSKTTSSEVGQVVSCLYERSRSFLVEMQSLVLNQVGSIRKQTTQGYDANRLAMLIAVVEKYMGIPLSLCEVYFNITGGTLRMGRESDLAVLCSLYSSYQKRSFDPQTVIIGEVGLSGEVRSALFMEKRLKELQLMNYQTVITAENARKKYADQFPGLTIRGIERVAELKTVL